MRRAAQLPGSPNPLAGMIRSDQRQIALLSLFIIQRPNELFDQFACSATSSGMCRSRIRSAFPLLNNLPLTISLGSPNCPENAGKNRQHNLMPPNLHTKHEKFSAAPKFAFLTHGRACANMLSHRGRHQHRQFRTSIKDLCLSNRHLSTQDGQNSRYLDSCPGEKSRLDIVGWFEVGVRSRE